MSGLNEGQMVHFVTGAGVHLPAMIVKIWYKDSGMVNLTVFNNHAGDYGDHSDEIAWRETSIGYSDIGEPNTWHWNQED